MFKNVLKLAAVLFVPIVSFAQSAIPETFFITTDTSAEINLERKYWRMWDDSAANTAFKTVSDASFANRFHQYDTTQQFDFSVKTFWFKLKLKNTLNKPVEVALPWSWGMEHDIYYADSSLRWQHLKTGNGYRVSDRDGYKLLNLAGFVIQPNQEITIFERRSHPFRWDITYFKTISLQFVETALQKTYQLKNNLSPTSHFELIINAFLLGLILIACIFNITFYKAIKEKEYLYFSLFLFSFGLNGIFGIYSDVLFGSNNYFIQMAGNLTVVVWLFLLMLFIQSFFRVRLYLPKWDRFLTVYNYLVAASFLFINYLLHARMSTYWFDRMSDVSSAFAYLLLDLIFITIFLLLFNKKVKINIRLLAATPYFFFFGPVLSTQWAFYILEKYFKIKQPGFVQWVHEWGSLLILIGVLWMILFFSWLLFKRYESLQQKLVEEEIEKEKIARKNEEEKNRIISQQNELLEQQVNERTKELKESIENLKATQKQLIQSEKMASLGELTAGIAHEIQNPLNFVNNFSEVNTELLQELKAERLKPNAERSEESENELIDDVIANEQKINHHGKRADAIVKGMLQHSRSSSGQKEVTDINALCDEYLRLAYHGLRAKDKSFNASFETQFDDTIGKINIQPQEMGRVILNLINNAFYAVATSQPPEGGVRKEPTVTISTSIITPPSGGRGVDGGGRDGRWVVISVKDNGPGIPPNIVDKIFQPFFTTKSTGQGTGLGLSLSYDIVKAHGGELKVETKEGEGTTFVILLPV